MDELADWINPIVSGWMTYDGRFYRSQLYPFLQRVNTYLARWARKNVTTGRSDWPLTEEVPTAAKLQTVQGMVVRAPRSRTRPVQALGVEPRLPVGSMRRAE
ncbi:hypothetical protein KRMM14A1259_57680 [Krasilnikovia sp. MM14-A1259]